MVALGDRAVTFLSGRFEPPPADVGRVKALIAKLDDAKYAVRKKAYDELMQLGRAAVPALKEALKQPKLSAEARARVEGVVKNWTGPPPGTAQARRGNSSNRARILESCLRVRRSTCERGNGSQRSARSNTSRARW